MNVPAGKRVRFKAVREMTLQVQSIGTLKPMASNARPVKREKTLLIAALSLLVLVAVAILWKTDALTAISFGSSITTSTRCGPKGRLSGISTPMIGDREKLGVRRYRRDNARVNDPERLRERIDRLALLAVSWPLRRQRAAVDVRRIRCRHGGQTRRRERVLLRIGPLLATVELQLGRQFLEPHAGISMPGLQVADLVGCESGIFYRSALHACGRS